MYSRYQVLKSQTANSALARDVERGLNRQPKSLPSRYFYDATGSRLFQQITQQPEYYLTRCERDILEEYAGQIFEPLAHEPFRLIELGAGDGHKTEVLLHHLLDAGFDFEFVPIDICHEAVHGLTQRLRSNLRDSRLRTRGLVAEYSVALDQLKLEGRQRSLVLFLGSSIGNFTHRAAQRFLQRLHDSLHPGDLLLIGFDLVKDLDVLHRAYNDAAGITREFNFNLLDRINRELGADFDRRRFVHHGTYNPRQACMESWLVSTVEQQVRVEALSTSFGFAAWEGTRVERSFKYDLLRIATLATSAGFAVRRHWFDRRGYFTDALWEVLG